MSLSGGVCGGERLGGVRDKGDRTPNVKRTLREEVGERLPGQPLHDHVCAFGVLDVEDLRKPGIGEPARGSCRRDHLRDPREPRGERQHGDGPGEGLVDGLPHDPAGPRPDLID
jgi:hypothetical protein